MAEQARLNDYKWLAIMSLNKKAEFSVLDKLPTSLSDCHQIPIGPLFSNEDSINV